MIAQVAAAPSLPDLSRYGTPYTYDGSVLTGHNFTLSYGIKNNGTGAAAASVTGFFLSTDSTITTSDTLLATAAVPAIAANGVWSSQYLTATIPATLTPGKYYVGAIADYANAVAEADESNNASVGVAITVAAPQPDFGIIFTPSVSATSAVRGTKVTISYHLENRGSAAAGASTTGIYLSTDSIITTTDTLLAVRTEPAISPTSSYLHDTVSVTIPATLNPGNYYLGVVADYDKAVAESSETNNASAAIPITVTAAAQPDLIVQSYSASLSNHWPSRGEKITVDYQAINQGTAAAPASVTGIYLSTDSTITTSDTLLATDALATIGIKGYSSTRQVSFIVPDTVAGDCYVGIIVDYKNAVAEGIESNNVSIAGSMHVKAPDLGIYFAPSLSSSTVKKGGTVTLSYTIWDSGAQNVGASVSGIYLSTDSTITTSDTLLGTDSVPALAASGSSKESLSVTLPSTLAGGTYYLGVIVDYQKAVPESSEANNASGGATIIVDAPDLDAYSTPTLSSSMVEQGATVTLSYIVDNLGGENAGASVSGVYLSTDSTITTSDTLLATDAVAAIAAHGKSQESLSIAIPKTLAIGGYFIGVVPDYNNAIAEIDETNNPSAGVSITVRPADDYVASTATAGKVAVGGSATGTIETKGDVDWFRVDFKGGVNYTIDVRGASSGGGTLDNPYFTLYYSNGTALKGVDWGGTGTDARLASFTPGNDAGGTYYIAAKNFWSGTGTYTVSVGLAPDDYAANATTTGNLTIGGPAAGTIEAAGDNDYFRVQLVAGTVYEFDLKGKSSGGGTLVNPALMLHDANNTALRWDDNGGRAYQGSSTDAQIVYIPQESGTYYLRASGSSSSTGSYQLTTTTLSPDYYVQAILDQPNVRWNGGAPPGTAASVTFSFPGTLPSEYSPSDIPGYKAFNETQKAAARAILSDISTYANIAFTEVSGSEGDIRLGNCYQGGQLAGATIPYTSGDALARADIALANEVYSNTYPVSGSTGYETLLHEIEHALGLKHPGNYNALGAPPTPPYLPTSQDASAFTVETYNKIATHDKTPMMFDIAALQYLYGANLATHKGDDTYTFSASSLYTIWDTGGTDTLNAASWTSPVTLDLNPGTVSYSGYVGTDTNLTPIAGIAFNTTIENAVGGSAKDKLLGNADYNKLTGNGGDDRIDGGAAIDTAIYSGSRGNYTVTDTGDPVLGFTVAAKTGTDGTDNLFDVERLQFADARLALDLAGNAGKAVKMTGALYGKQHMTKEYVGAGIQSFDSGLTMEQAAQAMVNGGMFKQLAGSDSNADFVKLVYKNVVGTAPGAGDLDYYVHLLDSGAFTQASLAVLAAETEANKVGIDLVGLSHTGIEYA